MYEALASLELDERFNAAFGAGDEKGAMQIVEKMIEEIDIDGDGRIDLEEFVTVLTSKESISAGRASAMHNRMSMIAHNIVAAHNKSTSARTVGASRFLIHPSNDYHTYFDLVVSALIVITVVTVPVCIGWDEASDYLSDFNLAIDLLFLLDVAKSFNTGYFDDNDDCVMDRRIIVDGYIRGWFLIDLVSSIPIERIIDSEQEGGNSGLAKANSSVKGLKLLKITKVRSDELRRRVYDDSKAIITSFFATRFTRRRCCASLSSRRRSNGCTRLRCTSSTSSSSGSLTPRSS